MSVRPLSTLYEEILDSAGYHTDSEGLVCYTSAEEKTLPAIVDKKKLFVPTTTALRKFTLPELNGQYIGFHPISESLLRNQSPIIKWLRIVLTMRLQAVMGELLINLAQIAADTNRHKNLSPRATEFLSHVPDIDVKTVENLESIIYKVDGEKNKLINIYLKNGGQFNGQTVHRSAIVSFPFIKEFENDEPVIFGVKLRKKDRVAIEKLFNWVIPKADDINVYSYGSTSSTAPYFHALINAYVRVATRLNDVIKIFKKHVDSDELHTEISWSVDTVDLTPYREALPPLIGNDGDLTDDSKAANAMQQAMPAAPAQPQVQQPQQTFQPFVQVNPFLPEKSTAGSNAYSGLATLGAEGKQAEQAIQASGTKADTSTMDWERTVMARSMGYMQTPPAGMPLGMGQPAMMGGVAAAAPRYPWLANQPAPAAAPVYGRAGAMQMAAPVYGQVQQPGFGMQPMQPAAGLNGAPINNI